MGSQIGFKAGVWGMKQVGILQTSLWLPVGCRGLRPGSLWLEPGLLSAEGWRMGGFEIPEGVTEGRGK